MIVIEADMEEGRLQLSSMCWVNVKKKVLPILDLLGSDRHVHVLVNSFSKAAEVNYLTPIFFTVHDTLEFVVPLRG